MRFAWLIAACLSVLPMSASATEEPAHDVLIKDGKFEVRQYQANIVAQVQISGDMRRAGNSGFRPLADYIFGNNTARSELAMTAPVTRVKSQKIAMTAPVTRTASDDDVWTVAFVMPSTWTMETLPVPNNPDVSLREVPGEVLATVKFSGAGREAAFERNEARLVTWLQEQGYAMSGAPRYAGYDAPWVPGPFRRNEVMIPVEKIGGAS
ncbi:MAG: heme-binding protein [Hyphomonas sp.]|nr:heme-binding protein [Hyphomonas sp.]